VRSRGPRRKSQRTTLNKSRISIISLKGGTDFDRHRGQLHIEGKNNLWTQQNLNESKSYRANKDETKKVKEKGRMNVEKREPRRKGCGSKKIKRVFKRGQGGTQKRRSTP